MWGLTLTGHTSWTVLQCCWSFPRWQCTASVVAYAASCFPTHQVVRSDHLSLHPPLGMYSSGAPEISSVLLRGFMLCPLALILAPCAENLGWRWNASTKHKDSCQFFTRPDFAWDWCDLVIWCFYFIIESADEGTLAGSSNSLYKQPT